MTRHSTDFPAYRLDDRYRLREGRVFLTGTQALARIMFDQARRDRGAGLNTAGFISGYRGSPLGGLDQELWRARTRLKQDRITFLPAVNEDLAATAVLGAQRAGLDPDCRVEGVFAMWYGKGPGVDRAGDALKHGNAYGSAPKGGVLVVAGDDHGCVSSSMPHQSDVAFLAWFMPTLNPASVDEYLAFGEYGLALSRYCGCWVGFKAISETVESARSVTLAPDREFSLPDIALPPGGLHIRRSDLPSPGIETRIHAKLRAVRAFAEANPIDRRIYDITDARFGFVTTGKAHLDLMEALRLLGLDRAKCQELGIDIYKVAMVWPLARRDALAFVKGKQEVLVIEEKRGIIESQFKEYFYDWPGDKPERMVGKYDRQGAPLIPWTGELSPMLLVPVVAARLDRFFPDQNLPDRARALVRPPVLLAVAGATRTPWFCSGCPHNISTRLPEGSRAGAGIGCHVMASWMDRETGGFAQMGGEGVSHVVESLYNGGKHIFQNLGEGTWYHSGSLAIRQAVAAGCNITYKILYNDAVAMTGGQPVDGPVSVSAIARTCRAEGVGRIALVSDAIARFNKGDFPPGTTFDDRAALDRVQREIREVPGVSVLIYQQTCAAEKRRRRKRGTLDDPRKFAYINTLVCEGCGDCSVQSNCLSVEPLETPFGRKRQINLSACNKDFSCLNGFCPGLVTVEGATRAQKDPATLDMPALLHGLPGPGPAPLGRPFNLLVTGVGGTGVITIGALISMAAHLEGKGVSVLDFTGFAQKFGTVLSHIRLGASPGAVKQVRIEQGAADAVIGCDVVVSSAPQASAHYHAATRVVLNRAEMPTGDLVLHRDARINARQREAVIAGVVGAQNLSGFDANAAAEMLLGDAVFANVVMLGFAWQRGLVPVGEAALGQAIDLNGVAVGANRKAFAIGRVLAAAPDRLAALWREPGEQVETSAAMIVRQSDFLTGYQNAAYGARYRATLARFRSGLPDGAPDALMRAAARGLFRLMAYKDEFEVARLLTSPEFGAELAGKFQGDYTVRYHLAPPLLNRSHDARGRPGKRAFGAWMGGAMRVLAGMKALRATRFNPFGYHREARLHRDLLAWYETGLTRAAALWAQGRSADCLAFLSAPDDIRGYGALRAEAAEKARRAGDAALA